MVQWRHPVNISRVYGTFILEQQLQHRHRANRRSTMNRQLLTAVLRSRRGLVLDQRADYVKIGL
jgi:hypothetical protein